ncbi:caspase, EACC1-associated type [Planomonospora venezuelensis]|uniref:WD40 repeat protein n=1 Tax=Planomonospora venezuelensis TaxID=1999 RepID=A0A841DH06_PLAVE|nr:caspase family protein [Planomonospora venezuelensis]MBB5967664.1 WD40 repeat protein [Planomonospora venezuelensis]GIN03571.1 hypothetical protein Pve01_52290 [Planomonospora venezuelensis]
MTGEAPAPAGREDRAPPPPTLRDVPDLALASAGTRVLLAGTALHRTGSRLPPVPAVPATLRDLGRCLVERAGLAPGALTVRLDPPTPADLGEALAEAAQDATSTLMFYYVGHGLVGSENELHLATRATADLTRGIPGYQALPYSSVRQVLARSPAGLVIVVLDCCFSGRAQGAASRAVDQVFDRTGSGACLLTSSSGNQTSWALPEARYTAFTGELIRLLDEGDPSGPRILTLDHVYRSLARTLPEKGFPPPRRQATDLGDHRAFAVNPAYLTPVPPPAPPLAGSRDEESPYRGLAAFGPEDADLFFGRDELTRSLLERVTRRFRTGGPLVVTGPSGSGKSSLLRAGVIPALRYGSAGETCCFVLSPGSDPLGELVRRLAGGSGADHARLRASAEDDPRAVRRLLPGLPGRALIVVDQFEEVFTACRESERRRFLEVLSELWRREDDRSPPAAVVLAVRADFFGHCAAYPALLPALQRPEIVGPMTAGQLRAVIEQPAARSGLALESGLTELLLDDLGADEVTGGRTGGALPLLSHALLATWQRRTGGMLTLAGYRASGGIARSLALSAEETFHAIGPGAERIAQHLLLRLVRLDDRTDDTRRRIPIASLLQEAPEERNAARAVLGEFVRARLVTVDEESAEITHEALIRAWPRLKGWIDTDRANLLVRQRLAEDADTWLRNARDPAYLYPDSRLAAARAAVERDGGPAAGERAFLEASARRARRRRRVATGVIAALTVLLLAAASAGVYALQQGREALQQRNRAVARQLADVATTMPDKTLSGSLALAAYRLAPLPETRGAVLSARTWQLGARVPGHTGFVWDVAFSPDGRRLASVSDDHTVRVWDVRDAARPRQLHALTGHAAGIRGVAFRPDGAVIATCAADGTVKLWESGGARPPRELSSFRQGERILWSVAFSPDGRLLALSSKDHTAAVWDVGDAARPRPLAVLRGHTDQVSDVAFGPDGRTLATASLDLTARVWDVSEPGRPKPLSVLSGHLKPLEAIAFAPGGRTLATGATDGKIMMWDLLDPARPKRTATLTDAGVFDIAFSGDGRTMLGSSYDKHTWVWHVPDTGPPFLVSGLAGHTNSVFAVTIRADGLVATASADQGVRLWRIGASGGVPRLPRLISHTAAVEDLALSPDGRTLADAADDNTARLWDVRDISRPRPLGRVEGHRDIVARVAFSPDSRLLATASWDTTVKLWDVTDPRRPSLLATLRPGAQNASSVTFSKDGRFLVTGVQDPAVHVWDIGDPARPKNVATLTELPERVTDMAVSPDGGTLAMATTDNRAYLYDVRDMRRPVRFAALTGHANGLDRVVFAPGGRLATASSDNTARLWDVSDRTRPRALAVLTGHTAPVTGLAVSRDGRTLATVGKDETLRLWDITDPSRPRVETIMRRAEEAMTAVIFAGPEDTLLTGAMNGKVQTWTTDADQAARYICGVGGAPVSRREWAQYVPDLPYTPPCG